MTNGIDRTNDTFYSATLLNDIDQAQKATASEERKSLEGAYRLLTRVYGRLWTEAYYDPYNDATQQFARPLADMMVEANKILKFRR